MRCWPLFLTGMFATIAAAQAPAKPADIWPGHVAGGQYYRSLDWGVSFWGPAGADQQFEVSTVGVLVRYSMPPKAAHPGWVITAAASRVKQELASRDLLDQSAQQLERALGSRVGNIKTTVADDKAALVVGRLACRIAPERGTGQAPTVRVYVYLKLRSKQYLTFVGEGAPAAGDEVNSVLDALAASVATFDPQMEKQALAEAAPRTAKVLEKVQPADWLAQAEKARPQWFRLWILPPARNGAPPPEPVAIGYSYAAFTVRNGGIEAVSSSRIARQGGAFASYQSAWADPRTGEELIRAWTRTAPAAGAKAAPAETFLVARRKTDAAAFEVTSRLGDRPEQSHTAKVQGQPYVPMAAVSLLPARLADSAGQTFGVFAFWPASGQVTFQTIAPIGPDVLAQGGSTVEAMQWQWRPAISLPTTRLWSDPKAEATLRIQWTPDTWAQAQTEKDLPADVRTELSTAPQWK